MCVPVLSGVLSFAQRYNTDHHVKKHLWCSGLGPRLVNQGSWVRTLASPVFWMGVNPFKVESSRIATLLGKKPSHFALDSIKIAFPYNEDPLIPHFEMGYAGVYLFLLQNIDCWF